MQLVLDLLVPGIIAGVSCYGMAKRVDVYDALLQGAAKGLEILLRILPALVTLLTVVAMLRASGALELAAELLAPALEWLGIPPETVGLMLAAAPPWGWGRSSLPPMARTPPLGARQR